MSHQNQRFVGKQYTYSTPTPNISKSQLGKSTPSFVAGTAPIPWVNYRCGLHHIESWIGSERARFRPGKKQWSVTSINGAFSNNAYMNLSTYVICDIYICVVCYIYIYMLYVIYIYICVLYVIYIYVCVLYVICIYICVCVLYVIYIIYVICGVYIYTYICVIWYIYTYVICNASIYIYVYMYMLYVISLMYIY